MSGAHYHGSGGHHRPGHSHPHHGHHHHGHGAPVAGSGRAFAIAVGLNVSFVVVEVAAGLWSGSMALLADAGHNLSDVLALLLAWGASILAARPARAGYTYGFKSSSILAAIANAALLWVALGAILFETVRRFFHPQPLEGGIMMAVAAAGIVINALSAALFAKGQKEDLNLRAAFVHLLADAAVSAGVVLAGAAIWLTGKAWIDPVTSLLITIAIGWGSWGLLKNALRLGLQAVPPGIDPDAVRGWLIDRPGVAAIHDLHIWPMSTTETALTAHLEMPSGHPGDTALHRMAEELAERFGIDHATIQIELGGEQCRLAAHDAPAHEGPHHA